MAQSSVKLSTRQPNYYDTVLELKDALAVTVQYTVQNFKWSRALYATALVSTIALASIIGSLVFSSATGFYGTSLWTPASVLPTHQTLGATGTVPGAHRPSMFGDGGTTTSLPLDTAAQETRNTEVPSVDAEPVHTSFMAQSALLLATFTAVYGLGKGVSWSMASTTGDDEASKKDSTESEGMLPSQTERKKIVPLALMFFCILFNYTILRDTKDVLMVTAPKSGAEVIPFLKTYVNLPGAVAFTVIYSNMSNRMPQSQVFYTLLSVFLTFFGMFALFLYPNRGFLHPHIAADNLAAMLPGSFSAPISIFRNWTFALFYLMAEMWGSVVVSILFWGLANQICTVKEAKKFYPLFGLGANVALIFSGQYVKFVSQLRDALPAGIDPWGYSLKLLMGGIIASGAILVSCYTYIQRKVMTDPDCVDVNKQKASKQKTKLSMKESAQFLLNSTYIRDLALLVICYGMSINIVEVTWKSRLKAQFPDPNSYSAFMGNFSSATGTVTLVMMLLGRQIFERFGWGVAAAVTPITLGVTGAMFFSLILAPDMWTPMTALLGTTPLMLAVLVGAFQNIMSKSAKYSLFDPCKEMAYIPLDNESRTKGKAAVDVIGNPLGKSGGSFIQQGLIFGLGSLAASTPYLGCILALIISGWLFAARSLNSQFEDADRRHTAAA
jgi:AAA family ATP:ADP antiporter|eukprot:CAMPEP_0174285854 /NCGR_PEP_ID=MMETSP0809-20121228/9757_1 /TAXON_ID=73025 ORGANISM="Eutreptiella gymnastica-like, Strain CCMP1594" /NCGR_SAMPLE_ID=MMETSP0809 /ASSEMBLY_ACC=CAM_ASM_000658 /LENGTH=667 /DNA_ID=CAMNT_0015381733 /DNA_START=20 /DNA_END=2023 /DNA_ORIENTATION=-